MNKFGGKWTEEKIDIVVKYAFAYLTIMNKYKFKLIYFDGFAGSGVINESGTDLKIEGVARKIMEISIPRSFDIYYFVEIDDVKANKLKSILSLEFPTKVKYVITEDCNKKLIGLAKFLKKNVFYRALAFIDPHGMQVNWDSISEFKSLNVDMWMLIPTGIGVNRMLTKTGKITDSWMKKLKQFLGLSEEDIKKMFYSEEIDITLFGEHKYLKKENDIINKVIKIYTDRLKNIWAYVSVPYSLKNSKGSTMFHFILASQNKAAEKIASDIIKKVQVG